VLLYRPRCFAVVSLLTLSLLTAAHAGTYAFSGYPAAGSGSAFTSYGGTSEHFSVVANDKITAAFTWQPTNGDSTADPPPSSAIIQQTSSVSWTGGVTGNPPPTGACNTGLPASVSTYTTGTLSKSGGGTYYFVQSQPGSSFTVDCTPTASSSGSSGSPGSGSHGDVRINYSVSASPVTITPNGTTPDSSGALNILVGQGCTASLNTPPFSVSQQSGWTWNVSGTKFQSWVVSSDHQTATLIPVPSPLTDPIPKWFWNDLNQATETVSCTATVTPPTGQGSPITVTATQKVTVQVPGWTASGAGGYMQVNTRAPGQGGVAALWAGPSPGQTGGMNWTATCTTPQTPVAFGTGTLQLVQLVTPNLSYIAASIPGVVHNDPENGQNGLDTVYPYPAPAYTEGTIMAPFKTNDSPSIALPNSTRLVSMTHQFTDYLMYLPPSGGNDIQWVPRGTFTWSTNGNATIPSTGD